MSVGRDSAHASKNMSLSHGEMLHGGDVSKGWVVPLAHTPYILRTECIWGSSTG